MAQPDFPETQRIIYLITRYLDGSIDYGELQQLESWRKESVANEALFQKLTDTEQQQLAIRRMQEADTKGQLEKVWQTIQSVSDRDKIRFVLWKKVLVAATALALLTAFFALYKVRLSKSLNVNLISRPVYIAPGTNKARLTLSNGRQINLDDSGNGTIAQQSGSLIQKSNGGLITYRSAANASDTVTEYNTVTTPMGGQYRIQLPDGTNVWLNA